jgi:hypothetical protein
MLALRRACLLIHNWRDAARGTAPKARTYGHVFCSYMFLNYFSSA